MIQFVGMTIRGHRRRPRLRILFREDCVQGLRSDKRKRRPRPEPQASLGKLGLGVAESGLMRPTKDRVDGHAGQS